METLSYGPFLLIPCGAYRCYLKREERYLCTIKGQKNIKRAAVLLNYFTEKETALLEAKEFARLLTIELAPKNSKRQKEPLPLAALRIKNELHLKIKERPVGRSFILVN
jgi:hypothetical protein